MVMRENEMFSNVVDVVKAALGALGISGFEVLQQHQPLATNSHACLLVAKVEVHRYGWQGTVYDRSFTKLETTPWKRTEYGGDTELPSGYDKNLKECSDYIDEAAFQVSGYRPRAVGDAVGSLTAYDAVAAVAAWMMSRSGIEAMVERGLQPLRVTDVRAPVEDDDSGRPQFNPNFDLHFLVHQELTFKTPMIERFEKDVREMV